MSGRFDFEGGVHMVSLWVYFYFVEQTQQSTGGLENRRKVCKEKQYL